MSRRALDFVTALGIALALGAACRAQDPDLTGLYPKGQLRNTPRRVAPTAPLEPDRWEPTHAESHKIVAPVPPPTPTPTPYPQTAIGRLGERVKTLSTLSVGTWTGARWRGTGTGASDGGAEISITLPSGWKPTALIGPRSLGVAIGRSRVFVGGEVASGKVYGVLGFEPIVW